LTSADKCVKLYNLVSKFGFSVLYCLKEEGGLEKTNLSFCYEAEESFGG